MSIVHILQTSSRFRIVEQTCKYPRVDCGRCDGDEPARFVFTRHGSFGIHVAGRTDFAMPGQAIFVTAHTEFRISHPDAFGCDCCTDLLMSDETVDMLGLAQQRAGSRSFGHELPLHRQHVELVAAIRRACLLDEADTDAAVFDLLAQLLRFQPAMRLRTPQSRHVRMVRSAQEAILSQIECNRPLDELAVLAGCSAFHLCRLFREVTGESIRRFRLRQRLGTALGRLADGERDLSALACDLGFSTASHMTQAFRQHLGASPSQLRTRLRQGDLSAWRRDLGDVSTPALH